MASTHSAHPRDQELLGGVIFCVSLVSQLLSSALSSYFDLSQMPFQFGYMEHGTKRFHIHTTPTYTQHQNLMPRQPKVLAQGIKASNKKRKTRDRLKLNNLRNLVNLVCDRVDLRYKASLDAQNSFLGATLTVYSCVCSHHTLCGRIL